MQEILNKLVDQIVIAIIGALILAFQRWKASRDFDIARGQNQALVDLQQQKGVQPSAPPVQRRPRRQSAFLPRAPTPLPFWPVGQQPRPIVPAPPPTPAPPADDQTPTTGPMPPLPRLPRRPGG